MAELGGVKGFSALSTYKGSPNPAASETTFLEITFPTAHYFIGSRQDIEDRLDEALLHVRLGEVTGGGTGLSRANIDVEFTDAQRGLILEPVVHLLNN